MNYRKLAMLPVSLTISLILPILLIESGLTKYCFVIDCLKRRTVANDAKSLTFLLPCISFISVFFGFEILRHLVSSSCHSFRKRLDQTRRKLTTLSLVFFSTMLTCYIMKLKDEVLLQYTITFCVFLLFYSFCCLFGTSQLSFITSCSLYFIVCLMLCFTYVKYFSLSYNLMMSVIKRY